MQYVEDLLIFSEIDQLVARFVIHDKNQTATMLHFLQRYQYNQPEKEPEVSGKYEFFMWRISGQNF